MARAATNEDIKEAESNLKSYIDLSIAPVAQLASLNEKRVTRAENHFTRTLAAAVTALITGIISIVVWVA